MSVELCFVVDNISDSSDDLVLLDHVLVSLVNKLLDHLALAIMFLQNTGLIKYAIGIIGAVCAS